MPHRCVHWRRPHPRLRCRNVRVQRLWRRRAGRRRASRAICWGGRYRSSSWSCSWPARCRPRPPI